MFKFPNAAILITTVSVFALTVYGSSIFANPKLGWLLIIGPVLMMGWMAVSILKDTSKPVPELAEDENWGYGDRPDLKSSK